jgi:hypothetical protein
MSKALVIFSDNSGVWWLKFLKAGFRHCFIILETDRGCLWVDPLSHSFTIKILEGYELTALVKWYREMGMRVEEMEVESKSTRPFAWAPMTCVEVVKRLIGLNDWRVVTPWQLYTTLKKNKKRKYKKKSLDFCAIMR